MSGFLLFNCSLGPYIFTIVNIKKRPAITFSPSYSIGFCPLTEVIAWDGYFVSGWLKSWFSDGTGLLESGIHIATTVGI